MSGLELLSLGIGDAFSALWYSSCFALRAEGCWLLVDCPHPIRKMMREASESAGVGLDVDDLVAVALTHLHADHASGLEGLGYFTHFACGRKATVLAHPDVVAGLWHGHLCAGMESLMDPETFDVQPRQLGDYFEVQALSETLSVSVGPFRIECRKTIHHIPTTALRIHGGGRVLGYSADTTFDPGLIAWLGDCDLIVHEAGFGVHTQFDRLAQLDGELRRRMRLIHVPDPMITPDHVIARLVQGQRIDV